MNARVDKMVISYRPKRKKPQAGDRKTVKGVEYVRQQARRAGCYLVRDGRPVYEWVPVSP